MIVGTRKPISGKNKNPNPVKPSKNPEKPVPKSFEARN
jgi:hypothetical protein